MQWEDCWVGDITIVLIVLAKVEAGSRVSATVVSSTSTSAIHLMLLFGDCDLCIFTYLFPGVT